MARRNKTSRDKWENGFRVEVTVKPDSEEDEDANVSKSEDESSEAEEQGSFNSFHVLKSFNEELREITCVAMVANEVDAHGDLFTIEAVKGAAHDFISNFNISKEIGIDHSGQRPDIEMVGSWYAEKAGEVDGFAYPDNCWLVKLKANDDEVWESVKKGDRTGTSIEGKAKGYRLKTEDEDDG